MIQRGFALATKRALDVAVAGAALVATSPVSILTAVSILVTDGPPVLFRQERPGRGGRPFILAKFRTMRKSRDLEGLPEHDAERLTPLGRFLRKYSVDELPQLWNVLGGSMSLVGPRPLLMRYLERYTPEQARRHDVMPGITGWAQINGRNALSWDEKLKLDTWYVDHWTPWLDVRILFLTFWHVVKPSGVSKDGHASMPEFFGTRSPAGNGQSGALHTTENLA